ncbi:MAG: hypothetical protein ACTH8F_08445 [Microbacterium sp.]|uniref:hypothetical protein n=1 Tax=Microbacterium sp. TaxID=51671 RepID=UPI003F995DAC
MNSTTTTRAGSSHRDTHQTYEIRGAHKMFVTWCSCGHGSEGIDPDDADVRWFDHYDDTQGEK